MLKTLTIISTVAITVCACQTESYVANADKEVGASLNNKADIAIEDVPQAVLQAARARRPDLEFSAAEREVRNGRTYFDLEGTDQEGAEVELDIMQDGDGWTVVEIQRDIEFDAAPEPVREAFMRSAPGVTPDRIIESDQGDGVIIYEFFDRASDGAESKYEVKFDGETATFLTEEWEH